MQEESDILKHRHKGDYKSVAENKEMSRYKLTGIQEELNRKISQAITYFIGVDLKELTNVKIKSSNLFFMVDNVFLFPTSLLLTYIINQLEDAAEQLDRLYATLNTMTTSVINSEEL